MAEMAVWKYEADPFDGADPRATLCQLIASLIIENEHFSATVSHTTGSTKSKHHFLLLGLYGVMGSSTDVIVW